MVAAKFIESQLPEDAPPLHLRLADAIHHLHLHHHLRQRRHARARLAHISLTRLTIRVPHQVAIGVGQRQVDVLAEVVQLHARPLHLRRANAIRQLGQRPMIRYMSIGRRQAAGVARCQSSG